MRGRENFDHPQLAATRLEELGRELRAVVSEDVQGGSVGVDPVFAESASTDQSRSSAKRHGLCELGESIVHDLQKSIPVFGLGQGPQNVDRDVG
jgi:hypothetical protein